MKLSLSNLNPATTSADIIAHFSSQTISHLSRIHTVANVGKTHFKTFCFIQTDGLEQEEATIQQYDGSTLRDFVITVEKSR